MRFGAEFKFATFTKWRIAADLSEVDSDIISGQKIEEVPMFTVTKFGGPSSNCLCHSISTFRYDGDDVVQAHAITALAN